MLLDGRRVRCAEDREELVVGDVEEARERVSLYVEVVGERLLAPLQKLENVLELLQPALDRAALQDVGVLARVLHDLLEVPVDPVETFGFLRELLANVLASDEDRLEVHPLALHLHPNLDHLGDERQLLLPRLDILQERLDEPRPEHGLQGQGHVLDHQRDLVHGFQHVALVHVTLDVPHQLKLLIPPNPRELGDVGFNLELLLSRDAQLQHVVPELVKLHAEQIREFKRGGVGVEVRVLPGDGDEALPVPVPQGVGLEVLDERKRILETLDGLGNLGEHGGAGEFLDRRHLLDAALEVVREGEEFFHVQLGKQRLAQLLDRLEVRAVNRVNLLLHVELVRNLVELGVGSDRQVEQLLSHGELVLHRGLVVELLDEPVQ